jgi:hypothetical protein
MWARRLPKNQLVREAADGSELERVVAEIERALLPEGFTVAQRLRVPDPETGEINAELDIVIKGPLGSSSLEWLVECRDRPSDGPARRVGSNSSPGDVRGSRLTAFSLCLPAALVVPPRSSRRKRESISGP